MLLAYATQHAPSDEAGFCTGRYGQNFSIPCNCRSFLPRVRLSVSIAHKKSASPALLLPPILYGTIWSGVSLGSAGVSCASPVSSQFLVHPQPLPGVGQKRPVCQRCSAVRKTSLNYQHCFQQKSKPQLHTSYNGEN